MKERSLIAFTLLSQMAVGAFWTLGAVYVWIAWQAPVAIADELTTPALLAIGPVMACAMLASFFHLGAPSNAWRAFANLRSSWLSREILFAALFAVASVLLAGMQWLKLGTFAARSVVAGAAALMGLALIVSMSNSYRLRTVPAWDTWITPVSFLATALLLGGLAVSVALAVDSNAAPELARSALRGIALAVAVGGGVEVLAIVLWLIRLASGAQAAKSAFARITQKQGLILTARQGLLLAGIGVAGLAVSPVRETQAGIVILAFALVLISEMLGRLLFYEARVRQGV